MTMTTYNSESITGIALLYYLMIHADGEVSEKEVKAGLMMIEHEGIDEVQFNDSFNMCQNIDEEVLYRNSINALSKCDKDTQIRTVAWISKIADSDGFVDPREWDLIYRTYELELKLDLRKILDVMKILPSS